MLKKILSHDSCAACCVCCVFDRADIWESPLISDDTARLAEEKYGIHAEYITLGDGRIFKPDYDENGITRCAALGEEGCRLGADKPYDCKIWPFRVMQLENSLAVTVSPVCKAVSALPLRVLMDFAAEGFADGILAAARENPALVKPYIDGYPILRVGKNG